MVGRIRVKTLNKLLRLYNLERDTGRPLIALEIAAAINCSVGHAYNYMHALEVLRASMLY